MRVELLTNAQINAIPVRAESYLGVHVSTRTTFNLTFAGARGDHYDVTPTTMADADILERILATANRRNGALDLRQWRALEIVVRIGNRWVAFGQAFFMHAQRMGRANPGAKYPNMSNTMPPGGWPYGGHWCAYASNSVGGAGNAPNAAMSADDNAFARQVQGGLRGGQARAACHAAFRLGNQPEFLAFLSALDAGQAPMQPIPQPPVQQPMPTIPPVNTQPMISRGSRGNAVESAQARLNLHGANPRLEPDGVFGPLTDTATRAFQKRNGLVVDGIIGPITWGALLQESQQAPTPPPTAAWTPRVNDIVRFTGNTHYISAGHTTGVPARPGRARVTGIVNGNRNSLHLVREPGGGSDVHGWVQARDVSPI